jgi:hypothetical protein
LRSCIHSATAAIWRAPTFGYHSNDSRADSRASSSVGAQSAIVNVAAALFTNLPIGCEHCATAPR